VTVGPRTRLFGSLLAAVLVLAPAYLAAQTVVQQPSRTLSLSKGSSLLLQHNVPLVRFTVGDPGILEPVVLSPNELLLNGKTVGSTSLILWETGAGPLLFSVEVTADAPGLERYLRAVMPAESIFVTASGNSLMLSGTMKEPVSAERAVEIAKGTGAGVIDNLIAPPAVQIMLQVRFAEVNRSGFKELSSIFETLNPQNLSDAGDWFGKTLSDGVIQFLLSSPNAANPNSTFSAVFRAVIDKGYFRSLAEPNLLTLPGKEATFLAGGEFPYPAIRTGGGGEGTAVTIVFKEFGIKLRFVPTITRSGAIRIHLAPEVSSLDFANGLSFGGFVVPSLLTRKAETEVELREGQFLAIAGLLDNETLKNVTKIPILGDLPILGQFFRSTSARQRQTELLVLISPKLVMASDTALTVPTGETSTWQWPGWMKRELKPGPLAKPPGSTPPR